MGKEEKTRDDVIAEIAEESNPYLTKGFFEFAIIATLMVAFFPWSLLFCLFFLGMENTKLLVVALLHDAATTLWAIFVGVVIIAAIVFAIVLAVSS